MSCGQTGLGISFCLLLIKKNNVFNISDISNLEIQKSQDAIGVSFSSLEEKSPKSPGRRGVQGEGSSISEPHPAATRAWKPGQERARESAPSPKPGFTAWGGGHGGSVPRVTSLSASQENTGKADGMQLGGPHLGSWEKEADIPYTRGALGRLSHVAVLV